MRIRQESQQKAPILPSGSEVAAALLDARQRSLDLMADLGDEQLKVPLLPSINPLLWEFGHVAWFQEKWLIRHLRRAPPGWPMRMLCGTRLPWLMIRAGGCCCPRAPKPCGMLNKCSIARSHSFRRTT